MKIVLIIAAFAFVEVIAKFVFDFLRREYTKNQRVEDTESQHRFLGLSPTIFKGILERLVIYMGLMAGFPQILIVFGTLKIATRIKSGDDISNDYFLIGNLLSIGFALAAYYLFFLSKGWVH